MKITLETERLLLRRLELNDAPLVYDYMREREIAANTLLIPYPYPEGAAEEWITSSQESFDEGEAYSFALVLKTENCFIGALGIHPNADHRRAELGYWLGKPYWNKGYITEAACRVIQFGFEELNLNRIYANYFTHNPASARVMQKVGMTFEGIMRGHYLKWGEFVDVGMYAILKADYEASQ
jgi:RimJ/RimL family protein N-acetyltransferase